MQLHVDFSQADRQDFGKECTVLSQHRINVGLAPDSCCLVQKRHMNSRWQRDGSEKRTLLFVRVRGDRAKPLDPWNNCTGSVQFNTRLYYL